MSDDQHPDDLLIVPLSDRPVEFEPTTAIPTVPAGPLPVDAVPTGYVATQHVPTGYLPVDDPALPPTTVVPTVPVVPGVPGEPPFVDPPWWRRHPGAGIAAGSVVLLGIAGLVWWASDDDEQVVMVASSAPSTVAASVVSVAASLPLVTTAPPAPATTVEAPVATTIAPETAPPTLATTPTTVAPATVATTVANTTATTTATTVATTVPATVAPSTTIAGAPVVTPAPSPNATLYDVVAGNAELSRLLDLIEIAEIAAELDAEQPRTLLAPSNAAIDAFAATPQGAAILADPAQLRQLLLDHLVTESLDTATMFGRQTLTTVGGSSLPIDATARTVDGASVLVADVGSANGILHVVSTVISGASF